MDMDDIYPGCIIRASVNFFAYDFKGKKGVSGRTAECNEGKDGERIGGGSSAETDFAGYQSASSGASGSDDDIFLNDRF